MGSETFSGVAVKLLPLLLLLAMNDPASVERTSVVVVVGAPGTSAYAGEFATWAERWQTAAKQADAQFTLIGGDASAEQEDHTLLQQRIALEAQQGAGDLWIVLIGHGTFDGRSAKFNLRGPDVTADEMATWLDDVQRPAAIINCASCSGPFINALSAPGRIVVTATRSGSEMNYCRFGDFLSRAMTDSAADIDKDGQTSLLEAFLAASRNTEADYKQQGRLATEHALLDDNGDGLGASADWFQGVRAVQKAQSAQAVDGRRAHQFHLIRSERERNIPDDLRRGRDALELQLHALRDIQSTLDAAEYDARLEELLLKLARLYEKVEQSESQPDTVAP